MAQSLSRKPRPTTGKNVGRAKYMNNFANERFGDYIHNQINSFFDSAKPPELPSSKLTSDQKKSRRVTTSMQVAKSHHLASSPNPKGLANKSFNQAGANYQGRI